jgi:choline kinase
MSHSVAIILGAGRPFGGQTPSGRRKVGQDMNVLEWQAAALRPLGAAIELVAGYDTAGFDRVNGELRIHLNPEWESTGAAHSLFCCDLDAGKRHVITYADILFEVRAAEALTEDGDSISIAIDSTRKARRRASREVIELDEEGRPLRFTSQTEAHSHRLADLVGMICVPASFMPVLRSLREERPASLRRGHLGALLQALMERGLPLRTVDIAGAWIDLDNSGDLARFLFGSKAQTLARLAQRVAKSSIAPQVNFTVAAWRHGRESILQQILHAFGSQRLAVRSSAISEDSFEESQAGRYNSCLDVACTPPDIVQAVTAVIASYDDSGDNQILVQPMVQGVISSGVVFTRTLDHGAPYYVLNYSLGARTDIVTGGGDQTQIAYVHRDLAHVPPEPAFLGPLLEAAREIEALLDLDTLDIEFAIGAGGHVHVLQVRPLTVEHDRSRDDDELLDQELAAAARLLAELSPPVAPVVGKRAIYGVMPDWNPAEIIGVVPLPLSAGLYRYLVMDDSWARQRAEFGYRDVRPWGLMRQFAGHAYVDVRASLNSFVPASLPEELAGRIVDAALDRLERNPQFHDKIEFEVIPTCLDLDFGRWTDALFAPAGITPDEIMVIREAYRAITHTAFDVESRAWDVIRRYEAGLDAGLLGPTEQIGRLEGVLRQCREEGVLPFAHLARCAFVAMSLLRTAVARQIISVDRAEAFLATIRTVSHELNSDARAVALGDVSFDAFARRYGHLRPGTYDILSPSYAEAPEQYLRPLVSMGQGGSAHQLFVWTPREAGALADGMADIGLPVDVRRLERFLRGAITGREYAKFVFTRSLCWALDAIAAFGARRGLDRDDMAFLDLADIRGYFAGTVPESSLRPLIAANRERHGMVSSIVLPPLLADARDIRGFVVPHVRPNFVGKGRIAAPIRLVETGAEDDIAGAVVLIERADPGYDWLFSRQIAGLVTAYGGANSHMAIRCAEFGLPAAIGVGEEQFQRLAKARRIELDCQLQKIAWTS